MPYPRALPVLLVLLGACLFSGPARAEGCIDCHSRPAEDGVHKPLVDAERWAGSVHAGLDCTDCHAGADAEGFDEIPHRLDADGVPGCVECHDDGFGEVTAEYERSVHAAQLETFSCVRCHDPHTMTADRASMPRAQRVREANRGCINCHRESVIRAAGREGAKGLSEAHAWIPSPEAHGRMRCIVCHTPIDGSDVHEVVPGAQAIRACDACHDVNVPLIAKYIGTDDRSAWVTNPIVFESAYVIGATRNRIVDGVIVMLLSLTLMGVLTHALLRIATRRNRPKMSATAEKVRMYPLWLRIWHWSNALLIVALTYTGLRLHFGQQRGPILSFETAFNVHNLAGSLLVIVGVLYLVANAVSGNQRQYLSRPRDGLRGVIKQVRWYLFGIFKGDPHPYHVSPEHKFNPLQHVTYRMVMYVLYPLLLLSGVVLLFPGILPTGVFGHPGAWWLAAIHWLLAAAAILFLLGHLYLGTMGDRVRDLYAAMIDGFHRHRKPEA